jgi:hypothetical protein
MKIRTGFVSNSSSSSFVVKDFTNDVFEIPHLIKELKDPYTLKIPQSFGGQIEYGRQRENYKDFGSRLNFAVLHSLYIKQTYDNYKEKPEGKRKYSEHLYNDENLAFLKKYYNAYNCIENVLLKHIPNIKKVVNNLEVYEFSEKDIEENNLWYHGKGDAIVGYIDHGSCWYEKRKIITDIFGDPLNENEIFSWLFSPKNYIANRSDEYEDMNSLEVDHRHDYLDWDSVYSPYENPEMFDKKGNFKTKLL